MNEAWPGEHARVIRVPHSRGDFAAPGHPANPFVLVGITGVGGNTIVFWVATRGLALTVFWAGLIASIVSTGTNFLLNDAFTWRDRRQGGWGAWFGRLVRYYSTTAAGSMVYLRLTTRKLCCDMLWSS